MLVIGGLNKLSVIKRSEFGLFLDGGDDGEVLLPTRYIPEGSKPGDRLEVFIYYDSEDRLIATTETPLVMVGEFAVLKVVAVENVGSFLDWGLSKDLFLPHAEQIHDLRIGQQVIVYVYLDKSNRISASMRLNRRFEKDVIKYKEGESVDLLIFGKTDLGYKAIVNGKHQGILYENEVFQPLSYGQQIKGFIRRVREDGKIDLNLQKTGHRAADDIAPKILEMLKKKGGFLAINDKTSAETIYKLFGVSKKKYKIALGGLYKKRSITVAEDGIRLVK